MRPVRRFCSLQINKTQNVLVIEHDGSFLFDALQARLHPAENQVRKLAAETPGFLGRFLEAPKKLSS